MIFTAQWMLCLIVSSLAFNFESLSSFLLAQNWLVLPLILLLICTFYTVAYFPNIIRSVPSGIIIMVLFSIAQVYLSTFALNYYDPHTILITLMMTTANMVALMLYSMVSSHSFNMFYGIISLLVSEVIIALALLLYIHDHIWQIASLCLWSLVFGVYVVYDVKVIVANIDGRYFSNDYLLAAMSLYIDIVGIILSVLKIISNKG